MEYVIYDPEKIMTRQELEGVWNKTQETRLDTRPLKTDGLAKLGGDKNLTPEEFAFRSENFRDQKKIEDLEKEILEIYKKAGMVEEYPDVYLADKIFSDVFTDMDIAEAGYRIQQGYGYDAEWTGVSSTFPKWVPEELRIKEVFNKVMMSLSIDNFKFPKGRNTRQRKLMSAILDEVDKRLYLDTTKQRDLILDEYDKPINKIKPPKTVRGRTKGSKGGVGQRNTKQFAGAKEPTTEIVNSESAYQAHKAYEEAIDNNNFGLLDKKGDGDTGL